jgi:ribosome biogenesis protein ERB1
MEKAWDVWQDEEIEIWKPRKMPKPITAPKRDLPTHGESYNPPEEYLMTEEEMKEWKEDMEEDRETNFIPKQHDCLRRVPLYENLIKENF